jgi:hypothetical protein
MAGPAACGSITGGELPSKRHRNNRDPEDNLMVLLKRKLAIGAVVCLLWSGAAAPLASGVQAPQPKQQPKQDPAREQSFTGTVVQSGESYLLRDESGKEWRLDSPERVKPYAGKRVRIQGRVDPDATIHVDSIEAA